MHREAAAIVEAGRDHFRHTGLAANLRALIYHTSHWSTADAAAAIAEVNRSKWEPPIEVADIEEVIAWLSDVGSRLGHTTYDRTTKEGSHRRPQG